MAFTFSRPTEKDGDIQFVAAATGAPDASTDGPPAPADSDPAREEAGALLVDLLGFLEANAEQHPKLAPSIAVLSTAVAEHRSGQSPDPLHGVRTVLDSIAVARRADRSIPEP